MRHHMGLVQFYRTGWKMDPTNRSASNGISEDNSMLGTDTGCI